MKTLGTGAYINKAAPSWAADRDAVAQFAKFERLSTSPGALKARGPPVTASGSGSPRRSCRCGHGERRARMRFCRCFASRTREVMTIPIRIQRCHPFSQSEDPTCAGSDDSSDHMIRMPGRQARMSTQFPSQAANQIPDENSLPNPVSGCPARLGLHLSKAPLV